ncbi:hypothetical protein [Blastopirellula retiformator]|uniref:Uncharacterized protein n=1 Tax=Blastopirellula retiformator TaxID=2527970 RepID=A0A5C5V8E3_9BACT|nr:hypothetical protein [Blastopirellula retiformator]TWT34280.1 hypothetical protein Enr8_16740 [Blastopirellula retiformator]
MFGWLFAPVSCPVTPEQRRTIEEGFSYLAGVQGIERLRTTTTILPTTEFFPATYDRTTAEVEDLKCRVARYMEVEPDRVVIHFYCRDDAIRSVDNWQATLDENRPLDRRIEVWIEKSVLDDPLLLVASLAMEIAFVVLTDDFQLREEQGTIVVIAELLTVYLGLGIFTANESLKEGVERTGHASWWRMSRESTLSLNAYGYALAIYALSRGESRPRWASHLRGDVIGAMRQSIRYLQQTSDCSFPHLYATT